MLNIEPTDSLTDIWEKVADQLKKLKSDRNSNNKLMVLSTTSVNSEPESRTVVLRDISFEPLTFVFFTDLRSPKVDELNLHPKVSVLLYDITLKRQLRCKANAVVISDQLLLAKYWEDHNVRAKDYATLLAPSTEVLDQNAILKEPSTALRNFSVILLTIEQIEVLELGQENHFRVKYIFDLNGTLSKSIWLVP